MAGTTTQSTVKKFIFSFNTNEGKRKTMSFKNADIYSSELATSLENLAQTMINNTIAFKHTFTSIDKITHNVITTTITKA